MASQPTSQPTPQRIMQSVWSFINPLALDAAIQIGVFDVLDSGPKTLDEVGRATGASVRGLAAIMNLLVGLQFLARTSDGRYALTPESSAFLVSAKPGYHGGFVHHLISMASDFLPLAEIVRAGKPPASHFGTADAAEFFEELVGNILPVAFPGARMVAEALGVSRTTQPLAVLDIGAGSGVWGIAFAQASPLVRVTAVDLPRVLDATRKIANQFGVADRFHYAGKDIFRDELGSGFSIATLGHIMHMAGPEQNRALLKNIFRALLPGGTLVIGEFIVDEDRTGPVEPLAFAVNMLVHTDEGNAYTLGEMRSWLEDAGFVNIRTLAAPAPSPLILADKPGK
ncbi:MAG: methyltransferase domain-containing protein [Acidobacteriota bacterium]|nr:methyltransferase domain-containing protein [Acidobacteriota bacterium]